MKDLRDTFGLIVELAQNVINNGFKDDNELIERFKSLFKQINSSDFEGKTRGEITQFSNSIEILFTLLSEDEKIELKEDRIKVSSYIIGKLNDTAYTNIDILDNYNKLIESEKRISNELSEIKEKINAITDKLNFLMIAK